jgi:hypothetical protein
MAGHHRALAALLEIVIMVKPPERTTHHGITKMARPVVFRDAAGEISAVTTISGTRGN